MEWPTIVSSFFGQPPHEGGLNYTPLLGLGSNQHQNQQMVNFDGSGGVIPGNSSARYSNLERQLEAHNHSHSHNHSHNHHAHSHVPLPTVSSAISIPVVPPPPPQPITTQTIPHGLPSDLQDTDGRSSTHSSSRPTTAPVKEKKSFTCKECGEVLPHEETLMQHLRFYHKDILPFPCQLCNEKFEKRSLLQAHMRKRHHVDAPKSTKKVIKLENGMFGCDLCDRTFNRQFKVYAHRRTHFPRRYHCHICEQGFYEQKYLKKHLEAHKKMPPENKLLKFGPQKKNAVQFYCDICSKGFTLERSLQLHKQILHEGKKPYKCHMCERGFWKQIYLVSHCKRIHGCEAPPPPKPGPVTGIRRKPGPKTNKTRLKRMNQNLKSRLRANSKNKKSHKITHKGSRDPKFLCEHCSLEYTSRPGFLAHVKTHLGIKMTPCWMCEEFFENEEEMNQHLKDVHNQTPKIDVERNENGVYPCPECGESFQRSKKYYLHRLKKHGEKRITCSFCEKGFVEQTTYKAHLNIHTGKKPYKCNYCNVGFANRGNLNIHVMRSHYRYNPLWCGVCSKIFSTEEMFKYHREEHDGKSPFMCEKCYKGFDLEEDHQKHITSFHKPEVEKRYTCRLCNKAFAYPKLLQTHMKICNKPKPKSYECKFCHRVYSYFCSLKQHYKRNCKKNFDNWVPENLDHRPLPNKSVVIPENINDVEIVEDFACKVCLFPFPDLTSVTEHITKKHPQYSPGQSIICCLRSKDSERDYFKADELLTPEAPVFIKLITFFCQACKIPYCSMSLLDKHVAKYHVTFYERFIVLMDEMVKLTGARVRDEAGGSKVSNKSRSKKRNSKEFDSQESSQKSESEISDFEASQTEIDEEPKTKVLTPEKPTRRSARINPDVAENEVNLTKESNQTPNYFMCKDCKSLFSTKENISKHESKYHPADNEDSTELEYVCELCDMHYMEQQDLFKHIESCHEDIFAILRNADEEDDAIDNSPTRARKKSRDKDILDDLTCKVCEIKYNKRHFLEKHIEKYHPNYPEGEKITSAPTDPGKSQEKLQCKICKITYTLQSYFDKHIERYHPDYQDDGVSETGNDSVEPVAETNKSTSGQPKCLVCGISYFKVIFLEKHIEKYHPNYPEKSPEEVAADTGIKISAANKFKCLVCPASYERERHWIKHMEMFHPNYSEEMDANKKSPDAVLKVNEAKKYQCKFCKIEYTKEIYLKKHIEKQHPDYYDVTDDPTLEDDGNCYNCKVCNLPYMYRAFLELHINKYHPDYYMVHPNDFVDHNEDDEEENTEAGNQNNDSNATDIAEEPPPVPVNNTIEKPTIPEKPSNYVPQLPGPANPQAPPQPVNIPHPHQNQHHPNQNMGHMNQYNHGGPVRSNCLYQQPRHHMDNRNAPPGMNNPQAQTGFQNCYLQQHHLLSQQPQVNPNTGNPQNMSSNYPHYNNNPCEALNFLDNHLRDEQIRIETNNAGHFNRVVVVPPNNVGERSTYFESNMNPMHVNQPNDFSYWDRVMGQPPINNNNNNDIVATAFGAANYNPPDTIGHTSFNNVQPNIRPHDRNPIFQNNPANHPPMHHDPQSDGEDPFDIPDTGFALNYDSDTCDDPKDSEKKGPVANEAAKNPTAPAEDKKVSPVKNKFEESFLQFSKTKTAEEEQKAREKEEEEISEARSKAYFCKKCPMYYLRDYFLEKHYQKEHPEFWKDIEAARSKKSDSTVSKTVTTRSSTENADANKDVEPQPVLNIDDELAKYLPCKICSSLYKNVTVLMRHYRNEHIDHPDSLTHIEEVNATIVSKKNKPLEKKFVCELCSKCYQRNVTLQKHFKTIHLNEKNFTCFKCDRQFVTKHTLQRHEQRIHLFPDKVYTCEKCDTTFKKEESLIRHQKKPHCAKKALEDSTRKRKARNTRKRTSVAKSKKVLPTSSENEEESDFEPASAKRPNFVSRSTRSLRNNRKVRSEDGSDTSSQEESEEEIPRKTKKKSKKNDLDSDDFTSDSSEKLKLKKSKTAKSMLKGKSKRKYESDEDSSSDEEDLSISKKNSKTNKNKNIADKKNKEVRESGKGGNNIKPKKTNSKVKYQSDESNSDDDKKRKANTKDVEDDGFSDECSDDDLSDNEDSSKVKAKDSSVPSETVNTGTPEKSDEVTQNKASGIEKTFTTDGKSDTYFHKNKIVKTVGICLEKIEGLNE